jgi:hypothetical protein
VAQHRFVAMRKGEQHARQFTPLNEAVDEPAQPLQPFGGKSSFKGIKFHDALLLK